jgi:hypothetical protein
MLGIFAIISLCDPLFAQIESVTSPVKVLAAGSSDGLDAIHNGNASKMVANIPGKRTKRLFMCYDLLHENWPAFQ